MSKDRKEINWLGWFFAYLFVTKVFIWHDKFTEYDTLWDTFIHYFIFRDSFIIVFVIGMVLIDTIIDKCNTPLKQLSDLQKWVIYHIVTYVVAGLVYVAHNWVLHHFFQATFESWQTLWLRWTVLYVIVSLASYVKFFMPKPKKKMKKIIAMKQSIRLTTGEEAIVMEIFNDGERYKVKMQQGDGNYDQREISRSDIKSVFERIETPFTPAS